MGFRLVLNLPADDGERGEKNKMGANIFLYTVFEEGECILAVFKLLE